jgi:hypothetical protein
VTAVNKRDEVEVAYRDAVIDFGTSNRFTVVQLSLYVLLLVTGRLNFTEMNLFCHEKH